MQRGEQTKGTEFVFPGEQSDVKASMMVFSYAENTDKRQGCLVATVRAEPGRVRKPSGCGRGSDTRVEVEWAVGQEGREGSLGLRARQRGPRCILTGCRPLLFPLLWACDMGGM